MAQTVPGSSTLGLSPDTRKETQKLLGLGSEQNDSELYAVFQADKLNRFYVPAVMLGYDNPPPSSARSVHILGHDSRAKFLAHSLHGVYDSVKNIQPVRADRYTNISKHTSRRRNAHGVIEPNRSRVEQESESEKNSHISNLVVSGPASQAVNLMRQVKHRVDDRTAICYLQDGLGVAEEVESRVLGNLSSHPSVVLGHLNQSFVKDRKHNAVRLMRPEYETALTGAPSYLLHDHLAHGQKSTPLTPASETWLRTQSMFGKFAAASHLKARALPLDNWLKVKISSLIFSSVADPLCVMLDYRYEQLLFNPSANRLVDDLLYEISEVVGRMYELRQASPELQMAMRSDGVRKRVFAQLRAKGDAPSPMQQQIERGQLTDIDYLTGYFMRRGRKMGLDMKATSMAVGMVKAKHKAKLESVRSYIPLDTTSQAELYRP